MGVDRVVGAAVLAGECEHAEECGKTIDHSVVMVNEVEREGADLGRPSPADWWSPRRLRQHTFFDQRCSFGWGCGFGARAQRKERVSASRSCAEEHSTEGGSVPVAAAHRERGVKAARASGLPCCAPRFAMSFVWWRRSLQGLAESLPNAADDPKLMSLFMEKADADHVVAWRRWLCGMRGLLARIVGGRRVALGRRSAGVGVSRRSARVAAARRRDAPPRECFDEDGLRPARGQKIEGVDGVSLSDAGSELGGWKQKCLQLAVLSLFDEGK